MSKRHSRGRILLSAHLASQIAWGEPGIADQNKAKRQARLEANEAHRASPTRRIAGTLKPRYA